MNGNSRAAGVAALTIIRPLVVVVDWGWGPRGGHKHNYLPIALSPHFFWEGSVREKPCRFLLVGRNSKKKKKKKKKKGKFHS